MSEVHNLKYLTFRVFSLFEDAMRTAGHTVSSD